MASTTMVKTTWKTKTEMERRPSPSPETYMDEVGPRYMVVEAIQGGIPPNRREQFFKEERNPMMMMTCMSHVELYMYKFSVTLATES